MSVTCACVIPTGLAASHLKIPASFGCTRRRRNVPDARSVYLGSSGIALPEQQQKSDTDFEITFNSWNIESVQAF